jgi:hypothetical protein
LISSNASPRKSSAFLSPILTLVTHENAPLEVIFTPADAYRARQDRADQGYGLHLLPTVASGLDNAAGDPSSVDRRSPSEPLVLDLPLLDAPSRPVSRGLMDFNRARIESLLEGPRITVGSLAQNSTSVESGRHVAAVETGHPKAVSVGWFRKFFK